MQQSILNPCLFFKKENNRTVGSVRTQLDDTLGCGNEIFSLMEQQRSKKFDVKVKEQNFQLLFGGLSISKLEMVSQRTKLSTASS